MPGTEDTPISTGSRPEDIVNAITSQGQRLGALTSQVNEIAAAMGDAASRGGAVEGADIPTRGLETFKDRKGRIRLLDATDEATFRLPDGTTDARQVKVPGLFTAVKADDHALPAEVAKGTRRYAEQLSKVNVLARVMDGVPHQYLHDLERFAKEVPDSDLRNQLTAHAQDVATKFGARQAARFSASPLSSASGSGSPGYNWAADTYIEDVLDVTDRVAGLAQMLDSLGGGQSLHPTAKIKARIITGIGGYAKIDRYNTAGSPTYPEAAVATDVLELTGDGGMWSAPLDSVDLSDPRAILDEVEMMQVASLQAGLVTDDMNFLHGDKQSAASSHAYAAAGLALLTADGRATGFAGQDNDPCLLEDGILAAANDRSASLDVVAGTSLSAATDIDDSRANFLIGHNYLKQQLSPQYRRMGAFALILTQRAVDKIANLHSATEKPVFIYASAEERAANPWLAGKLIDGTPVLVHEFLTSLYNSSGNIAASSSLDVMVYAALPTWFMVRGALDNQFDLYRFPASDKIVATRRRNRALWHPLPSTKKAVVRGYNVSFA